MAVVYEKQSTDISWYSAPITDGTAKDNYERIVELRKLFCHPLTINKDGSLNKKYFCTQTKETAMNWNDIELLQLFEGIFKHGVDSVEKWIKIQNDFLPQRDFIEVRLKLSQLLGVQDLSVYKDRIFTTEKEITDEYDKNKSECCENGLWDPKCEVALRSDIATMTTEQIEEIEKKEMQDWKGNVFDNPIFVYRTLSQIAQKNKGRGKGKGKGKKAKAKGKNSAKKAGNKNKNKNKKVSNKNEEKTQTNTIDSMFKKQVHFKEPISEKQEIEMKDSANESEDKREKENETDVVMEDIAISEEKPKKVKKSKPKKKNKTKNVKKPKKKSAKRKAKKAVCEIPEDGESEDEEMLCVE